MNELSHLLLTTHLLWLIPFFPLAGFLANGCFALGSAGSRRGPARGIVAAIAVLMPALSFVVVCVLSVRLATNAQVILVQPLWDWLVGGSFDLPLGLLFDRLSSMMLLFVTGVGTLIHVYSIGYMWKDRGFARFMAYLNLFMFSMIVLVLGDSLPATFLGWEGVGLCSYLLIGFWHRDRANNDAARKAFVVNRIGDLGFLLGAFALMVAMNGIVRDVDRGARAVELSASQKADARTAPRTKGDKDAAKDDQAAQMRSEGARFARSAADQLAGDASLGYVHIADFHRVLGNPAGILHDAAAAEPVKQARAAWGGWILAAALLIFLGCAGKSAQIPLLTWLPDAMAGPTPVSALIHAATMVTSGVYLIARLSDVFALAPVALDCVAIIGCATAVYGAVAGLLHNDIKKVLAYSTISQLGFMFMAAGVGAFDVALFHVFTHAFFKATLFLGAGSVIHALHHEQDLRRMGGLAKALPITSQCMTLAWLAIIGAPMTSGFMSKDLILERLLTQPGLPMVIGMVAVATALLTAIYMSRLMYLTFWSPSRLDPQAAAQVHESPMTMLIPMVVLAMGCTGAGMLWVSFLNPVQYKSAATFVYWLWPVLGPAESLMANAHTAAELQPWIVPLGGSLIALAGWWVARLIWSKGPVSVPPPGVAAPPRGFAAAWIDGLDVSYDRIIVRPLRGLALVLSKTVDQAVIGGVAQVFVSAVRFLSDGYATCQRPRLRVSLALAIAGVVVIAIALLWGMP